MLYKDAKRKIKVQFLFTVYSTEEQTIGSYLVNVFRQHHDLPVPLPQHLVLVPQLDLWCGFPRIIVFSIPYFVEGGNTMQLFTDLVTVSILKYLGLRFTLHIKMLNVKGVLHCVSH